MFDHRKLAACLKATMVLAQPVGQLYGPHGQPRPSCRPYQLCKANANELPTKRARMQPRQQASRS